jgi:hypothetical protein
MLFLAQAQTAPAFKLDGQTWAIIVATATVLMALYKFTDKLIEAKLATRKEKKNGSNGGPPVCQAHSGPLPLSEKSLSKAVDEIHELAFMGMPLAERQRKDLQLHDAQLNTSVFQERNFQATKMVAAELLRARKGKQNGKKPDQESDPNEDTAYWDKEVDKMLKEES